MAQPVENLESACGEDGSWLCERVLDWTANEALAGATEWFVAKPLQILSILVGALVLSRVLRWVVKRSIDRTLVERDGGSALSRLRARTPGMLLRTGQSDLRATARAKTLSSVVRGMASSFVWFAAVVWSLDVLEVDVAPLIAGAGIAGVALGFGAQNLVRDFLSGTFIILEDQYGVGDIVDLGEASGTVEKITLRVTRLRDVNGVVWHVPNGEILRVANKSQDWARAVLDVDVAYATDLDEARDVMAHAAETMAADPDWQEVVLDAPEVWGVEAFGPIGVTMRVVLKTRPAEQFDVLRELRRRVKESFDQAGIEMPSQAVVARQPTDSGECADSGGGPAPTDAGPGPGA